MEKSREMFQGNIITQVILLQRNTQEAIALTLVQMKKNEHVCDYVCEADTDKDKDKQRKKENMENRVEISDSHMLKCMQSEDMFLDVCSQKSDSFTM